MIGQQIFFMIIAATVLAGGLWAAFAKRTFHAALGLGVTLIGVAGIYIMLNAPLIGVLQVLVYVGGILTILVFAVMFVAGDEEEEKLPSRDRTWSRRVGIVIPIVLFAALAAAVLAAEPWGNDPVGGAEDVDAIATDLFREHLVAFEVLGILLTAAMIGALVIARPLVSGMDGDVYARVDDETLAKTQATSNLGALFPHQPMEPVAEQVDDFGGEEE